MVHPADVPTSDKDKVYKSDSRDARKLARELEKGLEGIYIPSAAAASLLMAASFPPDL